MKYTIQQFEKALLDSGLTIEQLETHSQFIRNWYEETEPVSIEELVEDFLIHWGFIE